MSNTRLPVLPGPLNVPGGGVIYQPGPQAPAAPRPEQRPDYGSENEFMSRRVYAADTLTADEQLLFTTNRPHGAIDVYVMGGGNQQGFPADFFLYAFNGGVRSLVSRARLWGGDYGGTPPQNPFATIDVVSGPIYLMGSRVVAEKYEVTFRSVAPGAILTIGDMTVSAFATTNMAPAPVFAGAYYPFRDGVSGHQKGLTGASLVAFGAGRQVLLAKGINTTASRRYFQIWDSQTPLATGLVWSIDIPANGSFAFELPAEVAAAGLALRQGCTVGISTAPGSYVAATDGNVLWNAIIR